VKANVLSKEDKVIKKSEDSFEVFVKVDAQRNVANKRIIECISRIYKLNKSEELKKDFEVIKKYVD